MNKQINLLTIGADIELILQDELTGEPVSAEGIIQGTKDEPFSFDKDEKYYATSLDNVLAEFCIPPVKDVVSWIKALNKSVEYVGSVVKPRGLKPVPVPSAIYHERWLQTDQAKIFGCEPDFNAYTKSINTKPTAPDPGLRSAGGHIHIGYNDIEVEFDGNIFLYDICDDDQRAEIVKTLDLFIGIPSVIMEPDNMRKILYGKAGAFRPKPYGLEYRTPSNFYLSSDELKEWVFKSTEAAIKFINDNGYLDATLAKLVRKTINKNDKTMAMELVKELNLSLV